MNAYGAGQYEIMNGLDRGGIFRLKEELSNLRQTFVKSTSDEYRRSSGLEKLVRFEQSGSALAKLQELSKQATRNSDGYEKSMAGYDASPSSSESLRDSNASSSSETMRKQGQRDHLSYRQPFLVSQLQESRRHSDIAWEKLMGLRKDRLADNEVKNRHKTKLLLDLMVSRSTLTEKIQYSPQKCDRILVDGPKEKELSMGSFLNLDSKRTPFLDYQPRTRAFKTWEDNLRNRCSNALIRKAHGHPGEPPVPCEERFSTASDHGINDEALERLNQERETISKNHFASDWAKIF